MKKLVMAICILALSALMFSLASCGSEEASSGGKKMNTPEKSTSEKSSNVEKVLSKITINEQSSIRIATDKTLYFDPFCLEVEPHDADVIFITHAHYDHFSPEDIEKVAKDDTVYVIPKSMSSDLADIGIDARSIVALSPGESANVEGYAVETVSAYNTNKSFHPKSNGWVGYIITVEGVRVYAAGDTDATDEAKAVKCDIALLPIGGTYTMDAKEARELAKILAPSAAIPIHYGTVVGSPDDYDTFADGLSVAVKKLFN